MSLASSPSAAQDLGSRQTREFVQATAQSDNFEILEAQTALAESKDPQVRSFVSEMLRDHTGTKRALQDTAARAGLAPPPDTVDGGQSMWLAALQSKRGKDFDTAYFKQQVLALHAALVVQQQYASGGDQPTVRDLARAAVPMISRHLELAERVQKPDKE